MSDQPESANTPRSVGPRTDPPRPPRRKGVLDMGLWEFWCSLWQRPDTDQADDGPAGDGTAGDGFGPCCDRRPDDDGDEG